MGNRRSWTGADQGAAHRPREAPPLGLWIFWETEQAAW